MTRTRMHAVHVDHELCDGCAICLFFCKPVVFTLASSLSRRGVYPATVTSPSACNGCNLCELACPQLAIRVREVSDDARHGS